MSPDVHLTEAVPPRVLVHQHALYGKHAWRATICDYTITERQRYYKHGHSADGATSGDAIAALIMIDGRAAGITPEITPLVLSSEPTSDGAIPYVYDDGGRADAGYTGHTGDCVTRAIAIATEIPYQQVYDDLFAGQLERPNMARLELRYGARARSHASPRNGVPRNVYDPYLASLGWEWTPTMTIGSGTKVHVREDELPGGRLILRLSRHLAAVIDGVLHDTHDCSRKGTRAVYGYWSKP